MRPPGEWLGTGRGGAGAGSSGLMEMQNERAEREPGFRRAWPLNLVAALTAGKVRMCMCERRKAHEVACLPEAAQYSVLGVSLQPAAVFPIP